LRTSSGPPHYDAPQTNHAVVIPQGGEGTVKINISKSFHEEKLAITNTEHKDVFSFEKFLTKAKSHKFYENLKKTEGIQNSEDEYIDGISLDETEN